MKTLHIIFGNSSNPYVRFNMDERTFRNELRKWKRNYNIVSANWNDTILTISVTQKSERELHEMKKARQEYYNRMKRRARNTAIYWQEKFSEKSMSYEELAEAQSHFKKLGKRYGLLTEFRENCIC